MATQSSMIAIEQRNKAEIQRERATHLFFETKILKDKADKKALEASRQRQLADQQRKQAIAARNAEQVARRNETRQREKAEQQAILALTQFKVAQQQRTRAEQEKVRAEQALQQAELQTRRADEEAKKAADASLRLEAFKFLSAWEPLYLAPNTENGFTAIGLNHLVQGDELATGNIIIDGTAVDWRKGLTRQQAMSLLSQDLLEKAKEVDALVKVDINSNQRLALLAFVYNLGIDTLRKSTLLRVINESRFDEVPAAFFKWVNPGSQMEPYLRRRRSAEVDLWNTPPSRQAGSSTAPLPHELNSAPAHSPSSDQQKPRPNGEASQVNAPPLAMGPCNKPDERQKLAIFDFFAAWEPLYLMPMVGPDGFTYIGMNHPVRDDELETGKIFINTVAVDWKKGLSKRQAIYLLNQDLRIYDFKIDDLVQGNINFNRRLALLSLLYHVGSEAEALLGVVNNLSSDELAEQFMKFVPLGSPREAEIRRRRHAEIKLWNTPEPSTTSLEADSGSQPQPYQHFFKVYPRARVNALNFFSRWEPLYLQPRIWSDDSAVIGFNHFLKAQELNDGKLWIAGSFVDWRKGITDRQANDLLIQDLERANCKVSQLITKDLNPNQTLSILSFVYNLGISAFERSTLRKRINQGQFKEVPSAFAIWGRDAGLGTRRQAEIDLWNTPP